MRHTGSQFAMFLLLKHFTRNKTDLLADLIKPQGLQEKKIYRENKKTAYW